MKKCLCTFYLLLIINSGWGQNQSIKNLEFYNLTQKRWVVQSCAQFIYTVSQGQIDYDSATLYACNIYKVGRLFPYRDEYIPDGASPAFGMIESGQIKEAEAKVPTFTGEQQLRLLLELSTYYLYKKGVVPADLEQAHQYINQALALCQGANQQHWRNECLTIQGKIFFQQHKSKESEISLKRVLQACEEKGDSLHLAQALHNMGKYVPLTHPLKLSYLEKALRIFQTHGLKDRQLEVLTPIIDYYFRKDWKIAEQKLKEYLSLQQSSNYRHLLYTYYTLSFLEDMKSNFVNALHLMNLALENMNETGDSSLSGLFYSRMGGIYHSLFNFSASSNWYQQALATRHYQPKLFWYKGFFGYLFMLIKDQKAQQGLNLIQQITIPFKPETLFDSMYLYYAIGNCYDQLQNISMAEKNYTAFIEMSKRFPPEHIYGELPDGYSKVAEFYLGKGDFQKARSFLKQAMQFNTFNSNIRNLVNNYWLLYKLDSADGNYQLALDAHQKFKYYDDSSNSITQKKTLDEIMVKYEAVQKDKNIAILKQKQKEQQIVLQQNTQVRNIILTGLALSLIILILLYNQYRQKQRSNKVINAHNTALQRLVQEKEWLMKEIHHRVKNNLQTIVSLLELQSENLQDEALSALRISQNRIYAMSLLHQKLYLSETLASINMKVYLTELVDYLQDIYPEDRKLDFYIDISPVELDVSQAVPLGLIVNEALTNSLKHAQPPANGDLKISLLLNKKATSLELLLCDNGVGINRHQAEGTETGLGMKLIEALVEDLEGQLHIDTSKGTSLQICFQADRPLHESNPMENSYSKVI
jgi:two-component sensor histidine kinase